MLDVCALYALFVLIQGVDFLCQGRHDVFHRDRYFRFSLAWMQLIYGQV